MKNLSIILTCIGLIALSVGSLFLILSWPGASIDLIVAALTLIPGLAMGLREGLRLPKHHTFRTCSVVTIAGAAVVAVLKLLHLPMANHLLMLLLFMIVPTWSVILGYYTYQENR